MRFFLKTLLIYSLVVAPMLGAPIYAQSNVSNGLNPLAQSALPESNYNRLYYAGGVVNEYRLLGFNSYPTIELAEFKEALRTRVSVLQNNFSLSEANLNSSRAVAQAFRQYRQAFSALQVTGAVDYQTLKALDERIRPQVLSEFDSQRFQSPEQRSQRVQLEVNRRIIETFTEEQRHQANRRITQAKNSLNTAHKRAMFNIRNGLSQSGQLPRFSMNFSPRVQLNNLRGRLNIPVEDQFGNRTTVSWERDPRNLTRINAADLSRSLARGSIETGKLGLAFMAIMFGSALYKMGTDFESNPRAFEQTLDQTLSWAMPLSIGSFFVGGAATQMGTGYFNAQRKSISALYHLNEQSRLGNISQETKSRLVRAHMNTMAPKRFLEKALTNRGMIGGLLISKLMYLAVNKLETCRGIVADTVRERFDNYPAYRRAEFEQTCQTEWNELLGMVFANPQTWMELTALLSTKALMTWGMSSAQALGYGAFKNAADRAALESARPVANRISVKVVARGIIANPVVKTTLSFAAFAVVFEVVLWGLEEAYAYLSVAMPADRSRKKIEELFLELKQTGWNLESLCRDEDFKRSYFMSTFRSLWNWNKEETCGDELIEDFIEHHMEQQKTWRDSLMSDVEAAKTEWQNYTFKALNSYNATYLLYKDIAEQVRIKRSQNVTLPFDKKPIEQYEQFDEPLALFRAEPHFGWNYSLPSADLEPLSYPKHDGVGVNWSERANSNESSLMIQERTNRFMTTVVPALIARLSDNDKTYASSETQTKVSEILALLNTGDFNSTLEALEKIYLATRKEAISNNCSAESTRYTCYFHLIQDDFLDEELWSESDEVYSFTPTTLGAFSMLKNTYLGAEIVAPYGVKPLGMGQRFFIEYDKKLQNNSIDQMFFPEDYKSLTDYLTYQMVFGSESTDGGNVISRLWRSPEFVPPKAPTRSNLGVRGPVASSSCRAYFSSGSSNPNACLEDSRADYYSGIFVRNNLAYNSLTEYLYEELSDEFVNDFDGWWQENIAPDFEEKVIRIYEDNYIEKVAETEFSEIIMRDNYVSTCRSGFCQTLEEGNRDGFKASVQQQVDGYMAGVFDELIQTLPLDLRYSSTNDEEEGRELLNRQYFQIKSDIYKIIDEVAVRGQGFEVEDSLWEDYNAFSEELLAHVEVSESVIPENITHLLTIKSLLQKRLYQLSVLFKIDSDALIQSYYNVAEAMIRSSQDLDENEKEEVISELASIVRQMKEDRRARLQREGLVLIDYLDWPEDPTSDASPTRVSVVFPSLASVGIVIEDLMDQKIEQELILNIKDNRR